jgi:uncharacterized peroxidase-related enzyme
MKGLNPVLTGRNDSAQQKTPQKGAPMSRLSIPATIESAPAASQPLLQAVKKMLGSVPNLFRLVSGSPAALEGYLGLSGALGKGQLSPPTRERIALAVAEVNGCDYCLAAHTYLGKHVAKLDDGEIEANRDGTSTDPIAGAAVRFAVQVTEKRGHVNDAEIAAVRAAGYSDAQIIEIVQHVALNSWTNYINSVAATEIDFAQAKARQTQVEKRNSAA